MKQQHTLTQPMTPKRNRATEQASPPQREIAPPPSPPRRHPTCLIASITLLTLWFAYLLYVALAY